MQLTKFEHACFMVEQDGKSIIVDPGVWTTDIATPENVAAIVVTHEHPDHFDVTALGAIIAHNPEAVIFAHHDITQQLGDTLPHTSVAAGQTIEAAPFTLEFFGGDHATIHDSIPVVSNLGVLINNSVYYPGDSFATPNKPVTMLGLPVAAPWLKISEVINFATSVKASSVFPTHDAILSLNGKALVDRMITPYVESYGGTYHRPKGALKIDG